MRNLKIVLFALLVYGSNSFAQTTGNQDLPKVFERESAQDELLRLQDKKFKLTLRMNELKSKDAFGNAEEIVRIEGLIDYVNRKITVQEKIILSENYAEKTGIPKQGSQSVDEYRAKKLAFYTEQENTTQTQIKTTLTRYELEALPKDRQEKILSMPERYTIVD